MPLTPNKLRDELRDVVNLNPRGKVLYPSGKGFREATGWRIDDDGNLVLETTNATG